MEDAEDKFLKAVEEGWQFACYLLEDKKHPAALMLVGGFDAAIERKSYADRTAGLKFRPTPLALGREIGWLEAVRVLVDAKQDKAVQLLRMYQRQRAGSNNAAALMVLNED